MTFIITMPMLCSFLLGILLAIHFAALIKTITAHDGELWGGFALATVVIATVGYAPLLMGAFS